MAQNSKIRIDNWDHGSRDLWRPLRAKGYFEYLCHSWGPFLFQEVKQ
jgi:hypothetical protein